MRDAPEDWRRFDAALIPTKDATPVLDGLLAAVFARPPHDRPLAALDVGCGTGRLALRLHERGLSVTGVDVSPSAIRAARGLIPDSGASSRPLRFAEADFAADPPSRPEGGPFDVVICQLVISVIGDARQRRNLLRHAHDNLRPGGWLYLSASGVSDDINPGYARLYAADARATGERHTYFSRDDRGGILYATHHFTVDELQDLLEEAGFIAIHVTTVREASSRRPDEAAFFHYVTCRRDGIDGPT